MENICGKYIPAVDVAVANGLALDFAPNHSVPNLNLSTMSSMRSSIELIDGKFRVSIFFFVIANEIHSSQLDTNLHSITMWKRPIALMQSV